ncbi:hypothetical protein [Pandoraea sp.]|uniref:hypothetical protein n=1 Tax=Pandoraea sp. TaxID=1883445 RepID=UPI0025D072DF|nr:hypothetical protein [Pandoraea sp.]
MQISDRHAVLVVAVYPRVFHAVQVAVRPSSAAQAAVPESAASLRAEAALSVGITAAMRNF